MSSVPLTDVWKDRGYEGKPPPFLSRSSDGVLLVSGWEQAATQGLSRRRKHLRKRRVIKRSSSPLAQSDLHIPAGQPQPCSKDPGKDRTPAS